MEPDSRQHQLPALEPRRKPRLLPELICAVWILLTIAWSVDRGGEVAAQSSDNCVGCHQQQKDRLGQVVAIHKTSTHNAAGIGCDGCHGGDSSQPDKVKAHSGNFTARADANATLQMCGACHQQPLEFFKRSRHVAAQPNARRLDCAECHGVHAIGAASESFRWPQFCAGCHGLEYLPQLTRPIQQMLALSDDLREGLHRSKASGRAPAKELVDGRKEIRHLISEIVHQTDSKGAVERIPRILELGERLKQRLASEAK